MCFVNVSATAQMSSIQTSTQSAIQGKFKTFIVIDIVTNFVMAKEPILFEQGKINTPCFFTVVVPDDLADYIPGNTRSFLVHSLQVGNGRAEKDWVLENNLKEEGVFFARNKYINNIFSKQWIIKVDDENVIFQNVRTKGFLLLDSSGQYSMVSSITDASRWKLIYVY